MATAHEICELIAQTTTGTRRRHVPREEAVSYRLLPSRSADALRTVLGDYTAVAAVLAG